MNTESASKLLYGKEPTLKTHTLPWNLVHDTLKNFEVNWRYGKFIKMRVDLETFPSLLIKINPAPTLHLLHFLRCHVASRVHVQVSLTQIESSSGQKLGHHL